MKIAPSAPGGRGHAADDEDAPAVGPNLRRLRTKRGLSLERLAQRSGVSRAMLSQIELGQSAPTINLLWKIARSLGVPFSALTGPQSEGAPQVLRASEGKLLMTRDGSFSSRALFPEGDGGTLEVHSVRPDSFGTGSSCQPGANKTLCAGSAEHS